MLVFKQLFAFFKLFHNVKLYFIVTDVLAFQTLLFSREFFFLVLFMFSEKILSAPKRTSK